MNRTSLLICLAVSFLSVSVTYALDYSDFPENLQWVLNDRIEQMQEIGGFCIAGRITFDDGAKIFDSGDVAISVDDKVSEPIPVYYGGWFIMRKVLDSKYIGTENKIRVILRAFEYEPVDAYVAVDVNRPTYLEFQMKKTPDKKLCEVKGTVFDENRLPLEGAFDHSMLSAVISPSPNKRCLPDRMDGTVFPGLARQIIISRPQHRVMPIAMPNAGLRRNLPPSPD